MAALTTKLTVKSGSTTQTCTSYSVEKEGTVKTALGGTFWKIINNGITAYIGLWPVSVTSGGHPDHSAMKIKKDNTEYWVEKTVNNNWILTLAGTTNQTITLYYTQPDASQVSKTSTSSNQSLTVEHGTAWTASLTASTGFNAGILSASSGTINNNVTVSATAASRKTFTVTLKGTRPDGQSQYDGQIYSFIYKDPDTGASTSVESAMTDKTVTVKYGSTWTANIQPKNEDWECGTLNETNGTITGDLTIFATDAVWIGSMGGK